MRKALAFLATASLGVSSAQAATELAFVSCPILRDTASVPCWLTEYKGQLYFLTIQTDVTAPVLPPELRRKVLVEGTVSDEPEICGGKVLKPVRLSVMLERSDECRTMLPAEERYNLTFEPPRPPGPSKGRLSYATPVDLAPKAELLQEPYQPRTFELRYEFDQAVAPAYGVFSGLALMKPLEYGTRIKARKVTITGYRAGVRLTDGTRLVEREGLAEIRAKQAAEMLRGAGLSSAEYEVKWENKPVFGDASKRRTVVVVTP